MTNDYSNMKVFRDLDNLPTFKNAVITIGSYDGVHLGHQQIFNRIQQLASEIDGESIAITFHPHPRQVVYPKDKSLRLITTIEEKIELLASCGFDYAVIVPFTIEFSQQSPDEYIERLFEIFDPSYIVIGYDHRFGLNRQGDVNYLRWHAERKNFKVIEIEKQELDQVTISSTKIREAISNGEIIKASQLLNHPFYLTGKVVYGQQVGSSIGFPTANIKITEEYKIIPKNGIYAAYVYFEEVRYGGMLYIGDRPTLEDGNHTSIEVNIFDFQQTIYGREIKLELIEYIRGDKKLEGLEALKKQLAEDKEQALAILKKKRITLL